MSGLTLDTVRSYYQGVFRPDLTTIVVIGKVTPTQARATIEEYFSGWNVTGPKPEVDLPVAPPNRSGVIAVPDASRVQDVVILAQNLALTRSDPDYYPLQLGNAVLGGSLLDAAQHQLAEELPRSSCCAVFQRIGRAYAVAITVVGCSLIHQKEGSAFGATWPPVEMQRKRAGTKRTRKAGVTRVNR